MSVLAKAEAQKIIDYYGISSPEEIELNIISSGLGVYIEEKDIDGSEGRITHDGKRGFIAVNSQITYLPKKRFVIAHELGHFRLHKNTRLFNCEKEVFFNWQAKGSQESEANIFAAELLMPEIFFKRFVTGKMISLNLLSETANYFKTSLTSTAFRYADIGTHPIALVFCTDGLVSWSNINKDFTYQFIPHGMKVSKNSYAYEFFNNLPVPQTPEEIPLDAWFSNSYKYQSNKFIFEQCFPLPEFNAVLVLLWEK